MSCFNGITRIPVTPNVIVVGIKYSFIIEKDVICEIWPISSCSQRPFTERVSRFIICSSKSLYPLVTVDVCELRKLLYISSRFGIKEGIVVYSILKTAEPSQHRQVVGELVDAIFISSYRLNIDHLPSREMFGPWIFSINCAF